MKRFLFTAQVKSASGYQTFFVDAETREQADALLKEGGEIYAHEVDVTDLEKFEFDHETTIDDFGDFPPVPVLAPDTATAADYEEVLADHRRLVRELDVLLNGENAAQQASLCDLIAQVRHEVVRFIPVAQRCHCCGTGEVSLDRVCHNKSCAKYEKGTTIFQGNYVAKPVPKEEA